MTEAELRIDFLTGRVGWRWRKGGGRGQAVARAAGVKRGEPPPTVVDATAGLGRDAFLLAVLGCPVIAVERSVEVHRALADALRRAEADAEAAAALGGRLSLVRADARSWLAELPPEQRPQVVLVDPMHPGRGKSALVKLEMRQLRGLVGEDPDGAELLAVARAVARRRVAVKRPRPAQPPAPGAPHGGGGPPPRLGRHPGGSG